jgi:SHAQKYF class myb-like DNA-binding protein
VALSARKAGGAFQPFEKEKRAEAPASSATTAAASSAAAVVGDSSDDAPADTDTRERPRSDDKETSRDAEDKGGNKKDSKGGEEGQSQAPARKPRRCWAPELHRRFLQALQQLGGSHGRCPQQHRWIKLSYKLTPAVFQKCVETD